MTTETRLQLEALSTYRSASLARDEARRLASTLSMSERWEVESWSAINLGLSGQSELLSKYNV